MLTAAIWTFAQAIPLSRAPARTTRPVIVPFGGRGIRKSRTSSVSAVMAIFSLPVRGGPISV